MKQFILSATLLCSIFTTATAQNFLGKVPSGSSVVLKYAGENFSKSIPVKKIDSYNFIKQHFYKLLHADTMTSLENTGINFTQDTYQYVSMEDSSLSFVTLLHLKDAKQFLQLVKGSYKTGEAAKTERKNGFDLMAISPEIYIGWNETMAVIVNSSYKNKKNYYDYMYSSDTLVAVTAPVEVIKEEPVAVDTIAFTPPKIVKDKKPVTTKSKPTAKTKTKTAVKKPVAKNPVIIDEEVKEEETVVMAPAEEDNKYRIQDSINNLKRELWEQQQDMIAAKKQQAVAEAIINTAFNGTITSIENELSYKKIIDPAAHASIWLNTETLTKQYWNSFYMGRMFGMGRNNQFIKDTSNGYKSSVNIYFEKEVMRMEQKTFSEDANLTRLGNSIMNSKQNASLVKYVNPGNIGYFSMSVNTEAMANYYYTVVKNYISNMPYMNEYADIANVYIDLLEILIDEKGIADLMPGNALFVMHDMKSKWVTYTDYEYDKEFNYKEVKKTKKELSPDFTFVMETRKDAFMQKLANLPLKYAEKEHFNYKEKGGYYELVFDSGKYPISSLYFMIKEGKGIVTTSKEVVDMTLNNTGYTADADSKNSILNNNYSLKLNSKRLLETLKNEMSTDLSKKISTYLAENMGDVKMESSLKDGMIQGTTTMKTMGKHSNSLEFFFNMIESINDIMEKDRQEKEKVIN